MEYYDRDGIEITILGRSVEKYLVHILVAGACRQESHYRAFPQSVLMKETGICTRNEADCPKNQLRDDKARFPLQLNCEIALYIRSLEAFCKV